MDQAALDEVFPNTPLREVAFEVRFPLNLRVLPEAYRIQEALGTGYTNIGFEQIDSPAVGPGRVGYVFSDREQGRIIKVRDDRFAMNFTSYDKFESFKAEVLKQIDQFAEMFRVRHFTRTGLRYINNIILSANTEVSLLEKYIRPYVDLSRVYSTKAPQFRMELLMHKEDCAITARTGLLLQTPSPEESVYILDFDAFITEEISVGDLPDGIEKLHYNIQVEFLTHITEEYKDIMRGRK